MPRRCDRGGWRVAAALLAIGAAAPPARGDDLSGRGIVSYQGQDATTQDSTSVKQTYELRVDRHVTTPLEYRLRLRYDEDRGEIRSGDVRSDIAVRQLQPTAEVLLKAGSLLLDGGYDYTWLDPAGPRNERELRRTFARAYLRPSDLPAVLVDGEQRVSRDAGASLDQVDTSAGVGFELGLGRWQFRQTNRVSEFEDRIASFDRRQLFLQGTASYETAPEQRRVVGNVNLAATAFRRTESFLGASGGEVPREIAAARGLYAVDDSPPDSTDHPLASIPALTDGNLAASAGISVGPDGLSFQNVGVDMARFVELDELRIYVRDRDGNPLPTDGLITWVAYTSADGVAWIPAAASRSSYFPPLGYYEVRFDRTAARFFKAVSFGVTTRDAFVTEIQPVVHEQFQPREARTTWDLLGSATGQVRYRLSDRTDLTYYGLSNVGRRTSAVAGRTSTFDWDHTLGVIHRPFAPLTLEARAEDREVFTSGARATASSLAGIARIAPLPTLQHDLGLGYGTERATGRSIETEYVSLRNLAHLYPTLDVTLDGGYTSQRDRIAGQTGTQYTAGAGTLARLTPALTLTLQASWARAHDTVAPIQTGRNDRYFAQVDWRASAQLNLSGRLGWVEATGASGLLQQYRVFWNPFARGTIQLGLTYDEDVDSYTRQRARRLAVLPRWSINRHASLDLNYSLFTRNTGENPRTEIIFVTFTLTI